MKLNSLNKKFALASVSLLTISTLAGFGGLVNVNAKTTVVTDQVSMVKLLSMPNQQQVMQSQRPTTMVQTLIQVLPTTKQVDKQEILVQLKMTGANNQALKVQLRV